MHASAKIGNANRCLRKELALKCGIELFDSRLLYVNRDAISVGERVESIKASTCERRDTRRSQPTGKPAQRQRCSTCFRQWVIKRRRAQSVTYSLRGRGWVENPIAAAKDAPIVEAPGYSQTRCKVVSVRVNKTRTDTSFRSRHNAVVNYPWIDLR